METNVLHAGQGRSVWVVGDKYTFLATGDDTNGTYALIHALVPPRGGPPPHRHPRDDEAFYVITGAAAIQVDGLSSTATAGTLSTMTKGRQHARTHEHDAQA